MRDEKEQQESTTPLLQASFLSSLSPSLSFTFILSHTHIITFHLAAPLSLSLSLLSLTLSSSPSYSYLAVGKQEEPVPKNILQL
jgi:hypothetical protein